MQVSEKTKNKLQAFQFLPPAAEAEAEADGTPEKVPKDNMDTADKENVLPLKKAESTPVTRLGWDDLMGETKSPMKEDDDCDNEPILWHNNMDDIAYQMSPMMRRKGRKRARSSSPASSPINGPPATPAVNVKKLSEALKTPNADPTLALWDRFALPGATAGSPSGLTNPLLSHLLVSSSPRPLKDATSAAHQAESGLRRAISCGTLWPKRRKINHTHGPDSATNSQGDATAGSKLSMVSALLKTVNGEIHKSISLGRRDTPKSPSPQKRNDPRKYRDGQTPSKRHNLPNSSTNSRSNGDSDLGDLAEEGAGAGTSSSDYGDDVFDDDTLLELDTTMYTIPEDDRTHGTTAGNAIILSDDNAGSTTLDEDFGDLDDDLLEAAEDIINKAASQPQLGSADKPMSPNPTESVTKGEDDDPYGDDFGDFDFDAAELAATQSATTGRTGAGIGSTRPHVRTVVRR